MTKVEKSKAITLVDDKKAAVVRTYEKTQVFDVDELLEAKANLIAKHNAEIAEIDEIITEHETQKNK